MHNNGQAIVTQHCMYSVTGKVLHAAFTMQDVKYCKFSDARSAITQSRGLLHSELASCIKYLPGVFWVHTSFKPKFGTYFTVVQTVNTRNIDKLQHVHSTANDTKSSNCSKSRQSVTYTWYWKMTAGHSGIQLMGLRGCRVTHVHLDVRWWVLLDELFALLYALL